MSNDLHPVRVDGGCPDPGELARFIDGQLAGDARERVWSHVQRCDRCESIVGEAASIVALARLEPAASPAPGDQTSLERAVSAAVDAAIRSPAPGLGGVGLEETGPKPARPATAYAGWRPPAWLAVAAVVLVAVAAFVWLQSSGRKQSLEVADLVSARSLRLHPGWADHDWSAARGGTTLTSPDATAFRLGVWLTDLHVAIAARDRAAGLQATTNVSSLFRAVEFAEPCVVYYQELERRLRSSGNDVPLLELAEEAEAFLDAQGVVRPAQLALGKWTEAARLAAAAHDTQYFKGEVTRVFLQQIEPASLGSPGVGEAIEAVSALLRHGVTDDNIALLGSHLARITSLAGAP